MIVTGGHVAEGTAGDIFVVGVPTDGTSEIETFTITGAPTGGTFLLMFQGFSTTPIAYNANAAAVQAALNALPLATNAPFTCGGGALPGTPITISFGTDYGAMVIPNPIKFDISGLTGGAPAATLTATTPGVNATRRGAAKGALINTDQGEAYINEGTPPLTAWKIVTHA